MFNVECLRVRTYVLHEIGHKSSAKVYNYDDLSYIFSFF